MEEDEKKLIFRVVFDLVILIILAIPSLILEIAGEPFKRGFFCDDESLSHPLRPDTVPLWAVALVGLALNILVMLVVEFVIYRHQIKALSLKEPESSGPYRMCDKDVHPYFVAVYQSVGYFLLGCALSQVSTDISKYCIGRLRPFFLVACQPDYSKFNCTDARGFMQYITEDVCTGDEHLIKEARLSHPSGHSSFAVFCMVYFCLYLQAKLTWRGSYLCKYLLEAAALYLALYVCLSRISDYRHHWSDVLGGAAIGAIVALIVGVLISDLFRRKYSRSLSRRVQELHRLTDNQNDGYGSMGYEISHIQMSNVK